MKARQPTVVSLLSGATETIYELGLESHLVGISHECDFPPACLQLPVCSFARVDDTGTAAAIDAQVKQMSNSDVPMYQLDGDKVSSLAPDVIIVQDSCRICAVSPGEISCESHLLQCRTSALGRTMLACTHHLISFDVPECMPFTARALEQARPSTATSSRSFRRH